RLDRPGGGTGARHRPARLYGRRRIHEHHGSHQASFRWMSGRGSRDSERGAAPVARLSLLDRLRDLEPDQQRGPPLSPTESIAAVRHSLRRDLEALLNTRRRWRSWPEGYTELEVSPVGYGISDFSAGAFNDPQRRERLRSDVEQTIRRFEPRL